MFRKPIIRRFAWWTTFLLLLLFTIVWIGSYFAGLVVFLPSKQPPVHIYGYYRFYPGHTVACIEGYVCVLPVSFRGDRRAELIYDLQEKAEVSDLVDAARTAPELGLALTGRQEQVYVVPLWWPVIILAVPIAFMTMRSRSRRKSECNGLRFK